jgi:hypothetical protein
VALELEMDDSEKRDRRRAIRVHEYAGFADISRGDRGKANSTGGVFPGQSGGHADLPANRSLM